MENRETLKEVAQRAKKHKKIRAGLAKALLRTDSFGRIVPADMPVQREIMALMADVPMELNTLRAILNDAEKALAKLTTTYIEAVQQKIKDTPVLATGLYSEREAADLLGIHKETLARQRRASTGPAFTKVGKRILYSKEALEAYIKKHTT